MNTKVMIIHCALTEIFFKAEHWDILFFIHVYQYKYYMRCTRRVMGIHVNTHEYP